MIHAYQLNGYNIILDVFSGSVHVVDEIAYDLIRLCETQSAGEAGSWAGQAADAVTAAQTKAVLADLAAGQVNILIGTHKLLGKQVKWHDLGLLIIDEEQKFGVAVKE